VFSLDGLFANLLSELIGIIVGTALTVFFIDRLQQRRERAQWSRIRIQLLSRFYHQLQRALTPLANSLGVKEPHQLVMEFHARGRAIIPDQFIDSESLASNLRAASAALISDMARFPGLAVYESDALTKAEYVRALSFRWEALAKSSVDLPKKIALRPWAEMAIANAALVLKLIEFEQRSEVETIEWSIYNSLHELKHVGANIIDHVGDDLPAEIRASPRSARRQTIPTALIFGASTILVSAAYLLGRRAGPR